jgi:PDZ domain-containing secreted protein
MIYRKMRKFFRKRDKRLNLQDSRTRRRFTLPLFLLFVTELLFLTIIGTDYALLIKGPVVSLTQSENGLVVNGRSCKSQNCAKDDIYMVTVSATPESYKPPLQVLTYYLLLNKERLIYPRIYVYGRGDAQQQNTVSSFQSSIGEATLAAFNFLNKSYYIAPVVTEMRGDFSFNYPIEPSEIEYINKEKISNNNELLEVLKRERNNKEVTVIDKKGREYVNAVSWRASSLQKGDILTQIDPIKRTFSFQRLLSDGYLQIVRAGRTMRLEEGEATFAMINSSPRPILSENNSYIDIGEGDIGGDSAGTAVASTIIDMLSYQGEYFNGEKVAMTGSIDRDGYVGSIGGITLKALSVAKSGSKLFFIPEGNCDELQSSPKQIKRKLREMKIVKVEALTEIFNKQRREGGERLCKL